MNLAKLHKIKMISFIFEKVIPSQLWNHCNNLWSILMKILKSWNWEAKTLNLCYSRCWLRVLTRVGPCFTFVFSFGLKFAYFPEFPGSDIETGSTLYVRNIIGNHRNRWLISFDSVFVRDFSIAIFILLFI